jgi:hypothetical protein
MEFKLLSKGITEAYCKKVSMPVGATRILADMAEKIYDDKELFGVYNKFYEEYINSGYWTTVWEPLKIHPYVEETFGEHSSLFYLHAALERIPLTEQRYSELGISNEIFVDTLRDIGGWVQNAYNLVGYYSIRNFSWIWRHLEARMFRLGRLQYIVNPFKGEVKGFYNAFENKLLLLADNGMELRANGDMQGVCGKAKTDDGFVTKYEETAEFYIGNPITPYGKGKKEAVKLKKSEWQKVLEEGDYLLEIHIPRDGDFNLETIKASYVQAREFYNRYFPELDTKGMACHTWLFTPQLQDMIPESSKIVQFQRQFYLYPTSGSVNFLWKFVFNELTEQKDAKGDTYLRSQVLNFINEDKEIFDMRGVFLDVIGSFGSSSCMDKYDKEEFSL